MKLIAYLVVILLLSLAVIQTVSACPVCVGDQDSSMTAGMNNAILVMLGIIGFVLSLIIAFFVTMWRRFKQFQKEISKATFIDEHGVLQVKKEKGVEEWNNI